MMKIVLKAFLNMLPLSLSNSRSILRFLATVYFLKLHSLLQLTIRNKYKMKFINIRYNLTRAYPCLTLPPLKYLMASKKRGWMGSRIRYSIKYGVYS